MEKKAQLYEGKAKKVFATADENLVIVSYKYDATAFNGLLNRSVPNVRSIIMQHNTVKTKRRYLPGKVNFSLFLFTTGLIYSSLQLHRQQIYSYLL